jgi:hypothetical protein
MLSKCRSERGYSRTFHLVGIDEFLTKLQDLREDDTIILFPMFVDDITEVGYV